jgi:hypothetical protein
MDPDLDAAIMVVDDPRRSSLFIRPQAVYHSISASLVGYGDPGIGLIRLC